MRCRAWLEGRYCRRNTKGTFCHVHRHLSEYQGFIQKMPAIVLQNIAQNLKSARNIQLFRLTCKVIHGCVKKPQFRLSDEYKYFKRFHSQYHVTVRQVANAWNRYERLDRKDQAIVDKIQRHAKTIQARTYMDVKTFNERLKEFNRFMSKK